MSAENTPTWIAGLRSDYRAVFVEPWSPYLGAILLILVVAAVMVNGLFWGVFGGLKFWGDWFNHLIGLGAVLGLPRQLESPLTAPNFPYGYHLGAGGVLLPHCYRASS